MYLFNEWHIEGDRMVLYQYRLKWGWVDDILQHE
jgi:hypothetical protein